MPTASEPSCTPAQVRSSFSASQVSLVAVKYGSRRRPVSSATRSSWPPSRSRVQIALLRRSCQTIARRGEDSVERSHTTAVSRWSVIPTATTSTVPPRSASASSSASRHADRVACQISSGWCSTHPGRGKCCGNSWYPFARTLPVSSTTSAVTPVVPSSMARTARRCSGMARP